MISKREIGEYSFQYADYEVTVHAKWQDHDYSHEKTPRYVVNAYARRIDGGATERFSANAEAPVEGDDAPSIFDLIFGPGEIERSADLDELVEQACEDIRDQIDGMYEDIGLNQAEEEFQARVEAEAAVESWTEVDHEFA